MGKTPIPVNETEEILYVSYSALVIVKVDSPEHTKKLNNDNIKPTIAV